MLHKQNQMGGCVRAWYADSNDFADRVGTYYSRRHTCNSQYFLYPEVNMKVILIENPKIIGPILRKIYGIKKVKNN